MPFGRSWAGRWLGASGAAIAVPTGLVLTIVVVAVIAGGDGGLGGLRQLTRGPEIPGVEVGTPVRSTPLDGGLPVLPRRTTAKAPRAGAPAASSAPAPAARRPSRGPARRAPAARPSRPSRPVTTPTSPVPSAPGAPTTPAPTTTPAPAAVQKPATRPNPLREGVRTVQGVVSTLPLLGPPVADAVGSVADLILPPLPGQAAPAP